MKERARQLLALAAITGGLAACNTDDTVATETQPLIQRVGVLTFNPDVALLQGSISSSTASASVGIHSTGQSSGHSISTGRVFAASFSARRLARHFASGDRQPQLGFVLRVDRHAKILRRAGWRMDRVGRTRVAVGVVAVFVEERTTPGIRRGPGLR